MEACHSVTTHCCHRCLSGQSTNLVVLRTSHSKITEAHIHLLRKLNSSLRGRRAMLQATSSSPATSSQASWRQPCGIFCTCSSSSAAYSYAVLPGSILPLWYVLQFWVPSHGETYLQNLCCFLEGFPHQNQSLVFLQSAGTYSWNRSLCCCSHRRWCALTSAQQGWC